MEYLSLFANYISELMAESSIPGTQVLSSAETTIQRIISVKFGLVLTARQVAALLAAQPEPLQQALLADQPELDALDELVERLSEQITGINYPTEHSTPYYKEYFKKKLQEHKEAFFGQY
jgi:hypothetical protein